MVFQDTLDKHCFRFVDFQTFANFIVIMLQLCDNLEFLDYDVEIFISDLLNSFVLSQLR